MKAPTMDKGTAMRTADSFNTIDEIRRRIDKAIVERAKEGLYDYVYLRRHPNEVAVVKLYEAAGYFVNATSLDGEAALRITWD